MIPPTKYHAKDKKILTPKQAYINVQESFNKFMRERAKYTKWRAKLMKENSYD